MVCVCIVMVEAVQFSPLSAVLSDTSPPPLPAFSLEYYTEVLDLSLLLDHLSNDPMFARYRHLNEALVGLVEDYSLVSFCTLNVQVGSLEWLWDWVCSVTGCVITLSLVVSLLGHWLCH